MLIGATQGLTVDEARDLGYTLTVPDCARLFGGMRESTVRAMLATSVDDPMHLPSAIVSIRGPAARRVRLADLEDLAVRLSLPPVGDLIRAGEAVAILAGKPLSCETTAYDRHRQRLEAARGERLTGYTLPGQRESRYSRREVQALKRALDEEGITPRRTTPSRAVAAAGKRAERLGLISTAAVVEMTGANESTVTWWGRQGWYGAQRIGWGWFFDPAKIAERPPRAKRQAPTEVTCARCGSAVQRKASQVRRARERAEVAGRGPQFFCTDCWSSGEAFNVRHVGEHPPSGRSERSSAAIQAQWDAGDRDRSAAAAVMRRTTDEICRSPKRFPAREDARIRKRHGHGLTEEQRRERASRALSRAQRGSARSHATRELENRIRELWDLNLTAEQIGDQLQAEGFGPVSVRYIWKLRERLGLPRRKPGRRPANS